MRFNLGAKVFTADGKEIGKVDRLVVDPRTDTVGEFVVHRGLLTQHDIIIPTSEVRDQIGNDDADELHLTLAMTAVEQLPQFEESAYVTPPIGLYPGGFGGDGVLWPGPLYSTAAPPETTTGLDGGAAADATTYPNGTLADRMERSRPDDVFINTGTDVKSGDKKLGTVDELVVDMHSGKVTELIVKRGLFGGKELRIPTQFIESIGGDAIYVTLDDARIAQFTVDPR